ncbi:protein-glutamate methylesterase/protein-glutamine glutaminase [Clostridium paraputrificum]|uniref:protein-glutamate methylesterase/protein-glutamine glutaminase n=1 Tax=Clostridium paraputrificum TaxID=29363 RepID=UPI003D34721D
MGKSRVIVVDDSAFMRKLISDMISSDEKFEIVAKLRNGKELLEKIDNLKPDIVTLDLEMPVLDGLSTLKELKRLKKRFPVIMLSSLTGEGSRQTIECLEQGAVDFIEKPSGSISLDIKKIEDTLLNKMHAILDEPGTRKTKRIVAGNKRVMRPNFGVEAILVGASTGGPKALQKVLTKLDGDIGVPVLVVQHMPKGFTKAFAERLDNICKLKVVEAEEGMNIVRNTIYIAPGGFHMTIGENKRIKLDQDPTIWGVRPAVDKLFKSAVKVYGGKLISVILTGMGRDGANGTEDVKDSGGITISQSESTCIIYGMPKAAYETGKVDMVLPLEEIGGKITSLAKGR